MGKIEITVDIPNDTDRRQLIFNADQCTENDIANVLHGVFLTVAKHNLVRRSVLIEVLEDIINDIS